MITATLTRPPSMTTKAEQRTACERKVYLTERVDIGHLAPPRSRTIYLEPISKRPKRKKQTSPSIEKPPIVTTTTTETAETSSDLDSTRVNNENSTEGSLSVIGEDNGQGHPSNNARSPVQSDVRSISGDSARSCSTAPSRNGDGIYSLTPGVSQSGRKTPAVKERTITATVELLRGGCLPGDLVPVKISVQHIRKLKSMHGVIVTLYRLGRIDSAPSLALSREVSQDQSKDEYYPKSKTGLGGLSLSSAGSCSVFRKDLSQVFTPLIIQDPETLSVTLTTSIRVPEDVFPTIKGVPCEMITFKYFVEVLVDLGGKLAGQIQGNKLSSTRVNNAGGPLGLPGSTFEAGTSALTSWGTSIIDTDVLRREKGVIAVVFEVVVGTTDSNRVRGKGPSKSMPPIHTVPLHESELPDAINYEKQSQPWTPYQESEPYTPDGYPQDYSPFQAQPLQQYSPFITHPQYPSWGPVPTPQQAPAPHYIPPPEVHDESSMTEKERVRRAEQRLLPSQPPEAPTVAGPSNSHFANVENIYDAGDPGPSAPEALPSPAPDTSQAQAEVPSAPTLEELSGRSRGELDPSEDKQELERRRLLAEASAPPDFPEDYDENGGEGSSAAAAASGPSAPPPATAGFDFEPSAPVLLEDEGEAHYGSQFSYAGAALAPMAPHEPLPKY
ncbi:hypothetical protein QBC42DRAFT_261402, partial [Cladorrhinum samala]